MWVPIPVVGKTIGGHTNSKQLELRARVIFIIYFFFYFLRGVFSYTPIGPQVAGPLFVCIHGNTGCKHTYNEQIQDFCTV